MTLIGASCDLSLEANDLSAFETFFGHNLRSNVVNAFSRAQIGRTVYTSKQYVKAKRRNNYTMTFRDGMQIKYGQIEFFCSYKETNESPNEMKLAFVNEFSCAGITLLQDTVTGGTCFHIVSLQETPVKRTVVALENILGKVVFLDLSSMPGIVFAAHFPNTLERD